MTENKQIAIGFNNKQVIIESLTKNYQIFTPLSDDDKDIYFIHADSDIQALYSSSGYYDDMKKAFILLLLFKPLTSSVIISASSFLSSPLTNRLMEEFKLLGQDSNAQFKILRKEADWLYYAEKREANTQNLNHIDRYKRFSKNEILKIFDGFSTIRKNNNTGWDTSAEWLKRIENLLPQIDKNKNTLKDISDLPEEILDSSIFVWEEIDKKLSERNIIIPRYSSQLRFALAESYLSSFSDSFIFSYDKSFNLSLSGNPIIPYYVNIHLLHKIVEVTEVAKSIFILDSEKVDKLIKNSAFLDFKSSLEKATSITELIRVALNNKKLINNAINRL